MYRLLLSFDKSFYDLFPATAVAMTTAFYVIKTYQSVFERRMRTLQFRSPGIAPRNADESAPGVRGSPRHDDSPRVGASVGRLTQASTSPVKNAPTSPDHLQAAAHCTIVVAYIPLL